MFLNKRIGATLVTCSTVLFLTTPLPAASANGGNTSDDGVALVSPIYDLLLAGKGKGSGNGPGDGTGNGGSGPKDGSGNGPGDCTTAVFSFDTDLLLARGGRGNGPGNGTGNGGNGPRDGSGNGPGTGTCINS